MKPLSRRSADDKMLAVIRRYNEAIPAANGLDDDETDALVDHADSVLARAVVGMPALTSTSALAALDLVISGDLPDDLIEPLLKSVRRYIASTTKEAARHEV